MNGATVRIALCEAHADKLEDLAKILADDQPGEFSSLLFIMALEELHRQYEGLVNFRAHYDEQKRRMEADAGNDPDEPHRNDFDLDDDIPF